MTENPLDKLNERRAEFRPLSPIPPDGSWGVSFGGGVNSKALLLLLHAKELRPDWVLFSDTGDERPETYADIPHIARWCRSVGFPFDVCRWVRRDGTFESISANCLRTGYLPSKAYGYGLHVQMEDPANGEVA